MPLLFAGEEWAATARFRLFTGHEEKELARAVSAGRREEFAAFGWDPDSVPDPQDVATFAVSKLDHSGKAVEPHASILTWYRSLLELRRTTPALRGGDRSAVRATGGLGGLLRLDRGISVVANLGDGPAAADVAGTARLAWPPESTLDGRPVLAPDGVAVLERR